MVTEGVVSAAPRSACWRDNVVARGLAEDVEALSGRVRESRRLRMRHGLQTITKRIRSSASRSRKSRASWREMTRREAPGRSQRQLRVGEALRHALAEILARGGRAGLFHRLAVIVDQRNARGPKRTRHEDIADANGATLDQERRHHAAAAIQLGFDDRAAARRSGLALRSRISALERQGFLPACRCRPWSWPRLRRPSTSPPNFSTTSPCCSRSWRTRSELAAGLSIC